jgi:hypothetical protein
MGCTTVGLVCKATLVMAQRLAKLTDLFVVVAPSGGSPKIAGDHFLLEDEDLRPENAMLSCPFSNHVVNPA